jgi:hypothetical protein
VDCTTFALQSVGGDRKPNETLNSDKVYCAEIEAIPATALRQILTAAIESHIPQRQWQFLKAQESRERRRWSDVIATLQKTTLGDGDLSPGVDSHYNP